MDPESYGGTEDSVIAAGEGLFAARADQPCRHTRGNVQRDEDVRPFASPLYRDLPEVGVVGALRVR